jgi:small-conductance mechanosensitive channel
MRLQFMAMQDQMAKVIPSLQRLVFYLVVTLFVTVAALYIFNQFIAPKPVSFSQVVGEAVSIIIIVGFSLAAVGIIRRFRPFVAQRMGDQASTIIYYVMLIIALLFAAFGILETIGVRSTDLLTGAGIISITAGLIISTFVGSILSGFLVFTNYKFKVGDTVIVNNIPGKVVEMSALIMRIRTDIGQITIPNSAIASGGVIITAVRENEMPKESRLHYNVGDRVATSFMNEQGKVKEITVFYTVILLDSGKEIAFLNNSILSGGVVIAKITQPPSQS